MEVPVFEHKQPIFPACAVLCLVAQCIRLFATPWILAHKAPLSMGILQAKILEWVAMLFSRGISPTQGLNPCLLHFMKILYHLSHQRSPTLPNIIRQVSLFQTRRSVCQLWIVKPIHHYNDSIGCGILDSPTLQLLNGSFV